MPAWIAASAVRTCLGDGAGAFQSLLAGVSGVGALRFVDGARVRVSAGYHVADDDPGFRASRLLGACVREAAAQAGLDGRHRRVLALVGTGLRELRAVERGDCAPSQLHFAAAVQAAAPCCREVITLANACSAGGHALALAQDLLELDEADAVIVGAADAMTESMLAMIGRFAEVPTEMVRPFDAGRTGVLLGEGAAALVLVGSAPQRPLGRVLATGLSCDAHHETVPDAAGIRRAVEDALRRAERAPREIDLVIAHGTGTALNDPTEAAVLCALLPRGAMPPVTAIKGALGHTSGAAALHSLDVALRCFAARRVPPIVGLRRPLCEGEGLPLVVGRAIDAAPRLAAINAFGFGGVNAVTLVAAP